MCNPLFLPSTAFGIVFRLQICHVPQRIELVQRDETDLVQLLNPHRLHLQVFCSTPWHKTLYDGLGAAAVRPKFDFERSCCLVLQQVFRVQRFNATLVVALASDSAEDSDTVACVTDQ